MRILFGIIVLHLLTIVISKTGAKENVPYFTVFIISLIITGYVMVMLFALEEPEP